MKVLEEEITIEQLPYANKDISKHRLDVDRFHIQYGQKFLDLKGTNKCLMIQLDPEPGFTWPPAGAGYGPVKYQIIYKIRDYKDIMRRMLPPKSPYIVKATYMGDGKYALWWKYIRKQIKSENYE